MVSLLENWEETTGVNSPGRVICVFTDGKMGDAPAQSGNYYQVITVIVHSLTI